MSESTMKARLTAQRERIERAAREVGRDAAEILIVAASKKQSPAAIREAYAAGQRDFGENYVQELVSKAEELKELREIRWHMIGHLQSNKCKLIAALVDKVHTISSLKLVDHMGRRVAQLRGDGEPLSVLVEVNVSGEASKSGCEPAALGGILQAIDACDSLRASGLMTMPPASQDPLLVAPFFRRLVALREQWGGAARLPELSMGMSGDAEVAVKEGATLVRIGSAIFGPRPS